jgi:hypothetical protein
MAVVENITTAKKLAVSHISFFFVLEWYIKFL